MRTKELLMVLAAAIALGGCTKVRGIVGQLTGGSDTTATADGAAPADGAAAADADKAAPTDAPKVTDDSGSIAVASRSAAPTIAELAQAYAAAKLQQGETEFYKPMWQSLARYVEGDMLRGVFDTGNGWAFDIDGLPWDNYLECRYAEQGEGGDIDSGWSLDLRVWQCTGSADLVLTVKGERYVPEHEYWKPFVDLEFYKYNAATKRMARADLGTELGVRPWDFVINEHDRENFYSVFTEEQLRWFTPRYHMLPYDEKIVITPWERDKTGKRARNGYYEWTGKDFELHYEDVPSDESTMEWYG